MPRRSTDSRSARYSSSSSETRGSWFYTMFGFEEDPKDFEANQARFDLDEDGWLTSSARPDRRYYVGDFSTPSVAEMRDEIARFDDEGEGENNEDGLRFRNVWGDAASLIADPANAGAVFQAASQFNCLEMVHPRVTPARGVTGYEHDATQGPASALACPAGTTARNYVFTRSVDRQMNTLEDVERVLLGDDDDDGRRYWTMRNGYALPIDRSSMRRLARRLRADARLVERCEEALRVGAQWDTSVGRSPVGAHRVAQVYASALPVAYSSLASYDDWEPFARLVLRAAYDATLLAARIAALRRGRRRRTAVWLTKLGDGAFGNDTTWVLDALRDALERHRDAPLDVYLVHYARWGGAEHRDEPPPPRPWGVLDDEFGHRDDDGNGRRHDEPSPSKMRRHGTV